MQLPTRQYLDKTVVPLLLEGITQLSKERLVAAHRHRRWKDLAVGGHNLFLEKLESLNPCS